MVSLLACVLVIGCLLCLGILPNSCLSACRHLERAAVCRRAIESGIIHLPFLLFFLSVKVPPASGYRPSRPSNHLRPPSLLFLVPVSPLPLSPPSSHPFSIIFSSPTPHLFLSFSLSLVHSFSCSVKFLNS